MGVSAALLVALGWARASYQLLTDHAQHRYVAGLRTSQPDPGTASTGHGTPAVVQHINGSAQNILVVGIDERAGLSRKEKLKLHLGPQTSSFSTDTLMLIHVPADGSKATLISIPRDTWVPIDGYPDGKINGAYINAYLQGFDQQPAATTTDGRQSAGMSELVQTVKWLTGVPIDHYVQVDFTGFEQIVSAIGSIPVNLCENVSDRKSGFHMSKGHHDLNPVQALEFVRQRHNIPGPLTEDFAREMRQRYFLDAAFNKILSARVLLNPFKLRDLINAVDNAFITDGNNFNLLDFAEQMSKLTSSNIKGSSIPVVNSNATINGESAVQVNPAAVRHYVRTQFSGTAASSHATHHHAHHAGTRPTTAPSCVY